jgi:hypothetical protein
MTPWLMLAVCVAIGGTLLLHWPTRGKAPRASFAGLLLLLVGVIQGVVAPTLILVGTIRLVPSAEGIESNYRLATVLVLLVGLPAVVSGLAILRKKRWGYSLGMGFLGVYAGMALAAALRG